MRGRPLAAVVVLAALLAAACDRGSGDDTTAATDGPATDAPVAVPGCDSASTATFPRHSPRAVAQPALLRAVDLYEEGCLDVVVFEFREPGVGAGLPPGYVVEYRPGPFLVGEGEEAQELDIAGAAFLVVGLEATARAVPGESGPVYTYTGNTTFVPGGFNHLQELTLAFEGEDRMEWVIGLDGERPFLVDAAANPPRVAVKIA